jgi:phosphatidylserine/phosphatidylglycerophosphate/cardiolipin synthase-like enzyme
MTKKTTKKTAKKTGSSRQIPVSVGIALALLILGLYLLQVTGILDLGLFDALEQASPTTTAEVVATSPAGAGASSEIQVYFTSPKYPDNEADHHGGIDEALAADIAQARASVDVAAYEFNLESLTQALLDAHERGVQVRLVTDTDNVDERQVRSLRRAGIPIVEDDRGAIMHDKFVIIDQHIVWTGSWNLTDNGTYRNNNNAMRITSATLAQNYGTEFDEMFVDHAFGPTSPADTPHPKLKLTSAGKTIQMENYFAPEDQVAAKILARVQDAQESIRFLAFSFTDDQLGETIKQKSKDGLTVQGVFEARGSDTEYSEYGLLRRARPPLDVLTDGNPYVMHHKVIILDGKIVILGSFNFSDNADQSNDENILIVYDADIAALYEAEFQRVYDQAAAAGN